MTAQPHLPTSITQHTLWTALTGGLPPLSLPPAPIAHVALDSRDVVPGDLFVALQGSRADGHAFLADALRNGAQALLVEERGWAAAQAAGATLIDCMTARPESQLPERPGSSPLAYVVPDSVAALQQTGAFQRVHRAAPTLRVVGVTGS